MAGDRPQDPSASSDADPDAPDDETEVPTPAHDDHEAADDTDQALRILAWTRKEGFAMATLQVGCVSITGLRDLRPRFGKGEPQEKRPATIFEEYGMKPDGGG